MNKIKIFWISLISTSAIFLLWNINIDLFKRTPSPINPLRTPANVKATCLELVADFQNKSFSIPTEKEFKFFFDELESYDSSSSKFMNQLEIGYTTFSDDAKPGQYTEQFKNITTGQVLLERRGQNESTAKILTELGYQEQNGSLMPPKNLPNLYAKIYKRLTDAALTNGLSKDDIIYPAIAFEKDGELVFIRPGIDSLPPKNEGWRYTSPGELSGQQFSKMIQEKKMLLSADMFFHDIGHIVDYIENPKYMIAYKKFQEKRMKALEVFSSDSYQALLDYGIVSRRGDLERYFNEWLYLPSIKNYEKIKKIIPDLNIEKPKSFENIQSFYFNKKDIDSIAQKFVKEKYTLFSSHGGGARDWSVERNITRSDLSKGYENILNNQSKYAKYGEGEGDPDAQFRMLEAPDLFLRLQNLIDLKKGDALKLESELGYLAKKQEMSVEDFADHLIKLHLAQIEYRIQTALSLKINPEQIANDTAKLYQKDGWKEYRKTATFAYYSTYPEHSVQWFLGVDVARSINPQ